MRTRLIASGLAAGAAALGAVLAPTPATAAPSAQVICIPEARVCAGVDGNATQGYVYTFTIRQPPPALGLSFTVNGLPAAGSSTIVTQPNLVQGWFRPSPALVQGDRVCMTISSIPGTYCGTAS
ncbi:MULTISPECIES: hypothetical protein [unclassified Streptomyces]|uniref:hypothetical protein n=1 Tax=unclassified Streptomyces TaxID=2593676 RepID=UPI000DD562C4|nr:MULTISPECIES: hypothetical protein [unclassified Streptomyces]QZZ32143.1 hypothetical protein A7X85_43355 [Streptomyces sp. ST1015]